MYTHKKIAHVLWIDCMNPTKEELLTLQKDFQLHDDVVKKLGRYHAVPEVLTYTGYDNRYVFGVFYFPSMDLTDVNDVEVDFVVGENYIITSRICKTKPLDQFDQHKLHAVPRDGLDVMFAILRYGYHCIIAQVNAIAIEMEVIQESVFKKQNYRIISQLANMRGQLIDIFSAIAAHQLNLATLKGVIMHSAHVKSHLQEIESLELDLQKVHTLSNTANKVVSMVWETNDSLVRSKTDYALTKLSVINFLMLPLLFFTSFFGMNLFTPDNNFSIANLSKLLLVIAGMFLVSAICYWYAKKNHLNVE